MEWRDAVVVLQGALVGVSLLVLWYGFHPIHRWRLRKIPGPSSPWLLGNLKEYATLGQHGAYQSWARYGPVYKIFLGAEPVVVVSDPDLARSVTLRNPVRSAFTSAAQLMPRDDQEFNEPSVFSTQSRDLHRSLKAAWLPTFTSISMEAVSGLMNVGAVKLCDNLQLLAEKGKEVDIWRQFGQMTMDVLAAYRRVNLKTQAADEMDMSDEAQKLVWAVRTIFGKSGSTSTPYMLPLMVAPFLKEPMRLIAALFPDNNLVQLREARLLLRSTVETLIRKARQDADAKSATNGSSHKRGRGLVPGSFLLQMVKAQHLHTGVPLSETEAANQAFTFLLAGYETTASGLAFTTYCLAANPDKLAKLQQEIDSFGRQREPTMADLAGLPYLEACWREGLRLFPPGVLALRKAGEDLNLGGFLVPRGTTLHVPIYTLHHDPKSWKDAEAFVPERWIDGTPEAAERPGPGAWMPFGDGMRVCLGQRFATQEAKITLVRVFQRFTFKLSPGQIPLPIKSPFTLGPTYGIVVVPQLRT